MMFSSQSFRILRSSGVMKVLAPVLSVFCMAATLPQGVQLHHEQTLIRNNGTEPETLDPSKLQTVNSHSIISDLFVPLTRLDSEGQVVPGLATTWKQTTPTTWVFYLRRNARWSNGEVIKASDVVYGVRRLFDPATASPYASVFSPFFVNADAVNEGKVKPDALGIRAVDDWTVEISTPVIVPFFPELASNRNLSPLHQKTIEKFGSQWTKPGNMVSNGAFVLKEWKVNDKIVLEKNLLYWAKEDVLLNKVVYLPLSDSAAEVKMFQAGGLDWTEMIPPGAFKEYTGKYKKELRNSLLLGQDYYSYNLTNPLLKDVRVRKALSMVIDREILANKILDNGSLPSYSILVSNLAGADLVTYEWANWPMAKKVEEAKKLLKEAGVKPGTEVELIYNTNDKHKKIALFIASEWKKKLNIVLKMENKEFKVLLTEKQTKVKLPNGQISNFQIARDGWQADYNDATTFLGFYQCGQSENVTHFCDTKADQLIKQGLEAKGQDAPATRRKFLTEAAQLIMSGYPTIPLLQTSHPRLVKSYVGGYSELSPRYESENLHIIKH